MEDSGTFVKDLPDREKERLKELLPYEQRVKDLRDKVHKKKGWAYADLMSMSEDELKKVLGERFREALDVGDRGRFNYKGWNVDWEINMMGYVEWIADHSDGRSLSDPEGGEFGGGTRSGIQSQIKQWIDTYEKGGYLPAGIRKESFKESVEFDVEKVRRDLVRRAVLKGGVWEDFGQKEIRELRDKYGKHPAIDKLDNWAMGYTGK